MIISSSSSSSSNISSSSSSSSVPFVGGEAGVGGLTTRSLAADVVTKTQP